MRFGISDTHPEAERVHIELLRKAGPLRRLEMAMALTRQAMYRAKSGIARARPEMNELERQRLFIAVHYGSDLATHVWQRQHRQAPAA